MIDAIARLGALTLAASLPDGLERYADLDAADRQTLGALVEPPGVDQTVVLEFDRDPPLFRGYHLEDCRNDQPLRYLYRAGPSNGALALPYGQITARLSEKERAEGKSVKVVSNRLVGWAKSIKGEGGEYGGDLSAKDVEWLGKLADEIAGKEGEMSAAVDGVQRATPGKTRLFLSVGFGVGEEALPLGDPSLPFARLFLARCRARLLEGQEHKGVCSLCGRPGAVSAKFGSDVFKFSTFDQPTYVAGGLDRREAWRSFPLCPECWVLADRGRRFIEEGGRLTRRVGTRSSALSYWVVPSLLNPKPDSAVARDLVDLVGRPRAAGGDLRRAERKVLLASEDDILDELKELGDQVVLSLIFVEKQNSREQVLLSIDDVLPSRLRRLFQVKTAVEERAHEDGYLRVEWEFTLHHHLFPLCEVDRGGKNTLHRPDFLAILDHAFRGVDLEPGYLASLFMGPIRSRFVAWRSERGDDRDNEWAFRNICGAAWLSWHFLDGLGIISSEEGLNEMGNEALEESAPRGEYFEWLEGFFSGSAKTFGHDGARVAFLLGSLTDSVRNVQLDHLGAAPFVKYLKSLRMEQRDLVDLLPRITQKLIEYRGDDKSPVRNSQMLQAVSFYLTRAGIGPWP